MSTLIISSDEEDNSSSIKNTAVSKSRTKRKTTLEDPLKLPKRFHLQVPTVVLNDEGEDEEFQLDRHTKPRCQLDQQKLTVPRPRTEEELTTINTSKKLSPKLKQSLQKKNINTNLPKLTPRPPETAIGIQKHLPMPTPLPPSLTITPVPQSRTIANTYNATSLFPNNPPEEHVSMIPFIKVKDIDSLKNCTPDPKSKIEFNSTLEINQSTNLFIVDSNTPPEMLNNLQNVKLVCLTPNSSNPSTSNTTMQQIITLPSETTITTIDSNSDKSGPAFKICNIQSLASKEKSINMPKRKMGRPRKSTSSNESEPKKRRLSKTLQKLKDSEVINLDEDNEATSPQQQKSTDERTSDFIDLDSDDSNDITNKNQFSEKNSDTINNEIDDVFCIEKTIDEINISSSESETDSPSVQKSVESNSVIQNTVPSIEKATLNGDKNPVTKLMVFPMKKSFSDGEKLQKETQQLPFKAASAIEMNKTKDVIPIIQKSSASRIKSTENEISTELDTGVSTKRSEISEVPSEKSVLVAELPSIEVPSTSVENELDPVEMTDEESRETSEQIIATPDNEFEIEFLEPETVVSSDDSQEKRENEILKEPSIQDKIDNEVICLQRDAENNSSSNCNLENTDELEKEISSKSTANVIFEKFLNLCISEIIPLKYRKIKDQNILKIRKRFDNADQDFVVSTDFKKFLLEKIQELKLRPFKCTIIFSEVLIELKNNQTDRNQNVMDKQKLKKIKKLEAFLKCLQKKICALEEAELDLNEDWDENSAYMKEERYKKKYSQVYNKLCELRGDNENANRPTCSKINFQESTYPQINRAVSKLYNKKFEFPNIHNVDKCIRKCIKKENLDLSEHQISQEVLNCFKKLGKMLQKRRQKELKQNLLSYQNMDDLDKDPADQDPELDAKLRNSLKEGETKMLEVLNKYALRQEKGDDAISESNQNSSEASEDTSD